MKKLPMFFAGIAMSLTACAQLQNPDFEIWENPVTTQMSDNKPVGWVWTNSASINPANNFYYPPATDAQNNNYALYLSVWYNHTKDAAFQRAAIDDRATALKGYYKYEHNFILGSNGIQRDTALISIIMTKQNSATNAADTIGKGALEISDTNSSYTEFTVNIAYTTAEVPDHITVILDPSLCQRNDRDYRAVNDTLGGRTSFFTVDNLSLIQGGTTTGITENYSKETLVYPNPVKDAIYMPEIMGIISILDISGRTIVQDTKVVSEKIDVSYLRPGTYFLIIKEGERWHREKFLKQ